MSLNAQVSAERVHIGFFGLRNAGKSSLVNRVTGQELSVVSEVRGSTYASLCDRAGVNKDILKRAVGHTPKSKTLDEVYLHPKATQMIEAFDKANQLVNDEVLTTTKA